MPSRPSAARIRSLPRRSQGTVLASQLRWSRERTAAHELEQLAWSARGTAEQLEACPRLPAGEGERFDGYGILGLTLASGDALAFRRHPASSIGPAYTSLWHRGPTGRWTFYANAAPEQSCARYAGGVAAETVTTDIRVVWTAGEAFTVLAAGIGLEWRVRLAVTPGTWAYDRLARRLSPRAWSSPRALALLGTAAGRLLGAGPLRLAGRMPTGHRFRLVPRRLWTVRESHARLEGRTLGPAAAREDTLRIGDLALPRRGLFAFGESHFEG